MPEFVSERTRALLAQSLPLVRPLKDEIISRSETSLRQVDGETEAFGQSEVTAMILVELLIDQAEEIVRTGSAADLDSTPIELRSLGIEGRHYSRFADALVAILYDLLGARVPAEVGSAWCDAFWAIIHSARSQPALAEA